MNTATACPDDVVTVVVCVDDTDDETKSTSTGKVAGLIAKAAEDLGARIRLGTTRHQLLLREDVPYTSHNSSMAFEAQIPAGQLPALRTRAIEVLGAECVPSADPGLAIAVIPGNDAPEIEELIAFGRRAKVEYCSKESAFALADRIPWVDLSEHGGDGQGVVGALAGIGLRLSGADGRFRGRLDLAQAMTRGTGGGGGRGDGTGGGKGRSRAAADESSPTPQTAAAADVAKRLEKRLSGPVRVVGPDGLALADDMPVRLEHDAKPVYLGGSLTIVCEIADGIAWPLTKDELTEARGNDAAATPCDDFAWDNDAEELVDRTPTCRNCLHRRWREVGFSCMREKDR